MKKSKLILSFFFFCMCYQSQAQLDIFYVDYSSPLFQGFLKSKTYVVMTGDQGLDEILKDAATKYWNVTATQFIDSSDLVGLLDDPKNSFLMLITQDCNSVEGKQLFHIDRGASLDKGTISQGDLALMMGGVGNLISILSCSSFRKNAKVAIMEPDGSSFGYSMELEIPFMMGALNTALACVKSQKNTEASSYGFVKGESSCFTNVEVLKTKTLLLRDNLYGWYPKYYQNIIDNYPYKMEIVTLDNLKKYIEDKDNRFCIISYCTPPGQTVGGSTRIYDLSTSEMVYYHSFSSLKDFIKAVSGN